MVHIRKKRRDRINEICGLPDDQSTFDNPDKAEIIKKENEQLRRKELCH
jgi:hypothetical protein